MKPNELRIGNWVSHKDYSTEMFKVKDIYCNCGEDYYVVNTIGGKNGEWLNHIDLILPIPLTEELLLKCGFKKGEAGSFSLQWSKGFDKHKTIEIELEGGEVFSSFWIGAGTDKMLLEIHSIHQLQNLFYAITGEELEINL